MCVLKLCVSAVLITWDTYIHGIQYQEAKYTAVTNAAVAIPTNAARVDCLTILWLQTTLLPSAVNLWHC